MRVFFSALKDLPDGLKRCKICINLHYCIFCGEKEERGYG